MENILFVDDDILILKAFKRRFFRKYAFEVADCAEIGLERLQSGGPYAVIISDQQMPGMKGIDFLKHVKTVSPLSARIMLTGNSDCKTAVDSVNESQVFRYLNKPCSFEDLVQAIDDGIAHHKFLTSERELLEQTLAGSAKLLVDIMAANDPQSFQQLNKLRAAGKKLAKYTKHPKAWALDMTIMLSSIGDVMLPPEVRTKLAVGDDLNEIEQLLVSNTPKVARDLLLNIPRLKPVAEAIYYMNKGYDGSGFPEDAVKGDDIPLNARILNVVNHLVKAANGKPVSSETFDALGASSNLLDAKIVSAAEKCFLAPDTVTETKPKKILVDVEALLSGDLLLDKLETDTGKLALSANYELTDALIQKVRQFHKLRPLKSPVHIVRQMTELEDEQSAA